MLSKTGAILKKPLALQRDIAQRGARRGPRRGIAPQQWCRSCGAVNAALGAARPDDRSSQWRTQAIRAARSEAESPFTVGNKNERLDAKQAQLGRDESAAAQARETRSRLIGDLEQFEALIARRESQSAALAEDIDRAEARLAALQSEQARLRETTSDASDSAASARAPSEPERLPDGTRVIRVNPFAR